MEFLEDEMQHFFQEIENEPILPETSSSFIDSEFLDLGWSFSAKNPSFLSPETHPIQELGDLGGDLLADIVQPFLADDPFKNVCTENKVGFHSQEFDVLLQQSFGDSYETSVLVADQFENMCSDNKVGFDCQELDVLLQQTFEDSLQTLFLVNDQFKNVCSDNKVGFDCQEFDVLLHQSFEDSHETSFQVNQNTFIPLIENTTQNDAEKPSVCSADDDELGKVVGLAREPTSVCTSDDVLSHSVDDFIEGLSNLVDQTYDNAAADSRGNESSSAPFFDNIIISDDFGLTTPEKNWDYCSSKLESPNTLFSHLGLDQLLNGISRTYSSFERSSSLDDQSPPVAKRRRLESSLPSNDTVKPSGVYSLDKNLKSVQTSDRIDGNAHFREKKSEAIEKRTNPQSRSIPKDRLLTYERLAELRELIPNGEKISIDRLLQRTIKQLLFLQSVAKHAKSLSETELLIKGKDQHRCSNYVACEIENKAMICPLIVEDLSTPGQMLIEIMCQEQGLFLEMVDIIRGFGLSILRGCMEVHEATKIRAYYIVEAEANRFVSRHEIFSSLVRLLQLTDDFRASDQFGDAKDVGVCVLNNSSPLFLDRIPFMG